MRIVKRTEFVTLPAGTLYSEYESVVVGDLQIKGDTLPSGNDWFYQDIVYAVDADIPAEAFIRAEETGESLSMDFHCETRDGSFEPDNRLYIVWERADVLALIERLQETVTGDT